MNALKKLLVVENGPVTGMSIERVLTGKGYAVITAANDEEVVGNRAKNVALFFAAPFFGLAYALAFPVVALAALAWIGGKALLKV